ncbi:MAG: von Willebrand factor type A domain-containing protein [Kofleriaceae bacterium]
MRRGRPSNVLELLLIFTLVLGVRAVVAESLASLAGQVRQRGGAVAISGASVSVRCGAVTRGAQADAAGNFLIEGLPAGTCDVTASAPGFTAARSRVVLTAGGKARVTLALGRSATSKPTEVDAKEAPAPEPAPAAAPPPALRRPMPLKPGSAGRSRTSSSVGYGSGAMVKKGKITSSRMPLQQRDERPMSTEAYARIDDNPFRDTLKEPLSTFSADVDTASYSNLRRFLREGTLPPPDAVRIEEMINYFHYDYPEPSGGEPFSITTEVAASPWQPKHKLVRIGLAAPAIDDRQVPARNLVFLLDVSGSMGDPQKLPLLKQAMNLLVDNLRPEDTVAIAVYAGAEGVALPPTRGTEKDKIRQAIFALQSGGSTNGAAGIQLAYNLAEAQLKKRGINRVILCTDGDFNVGVTSEGDLTRLIEKERERGIFLTVLGFGMGNLKDSTMEKLADRGNGNYAYIDSLFEARKVLVKEAGATLVTVAKDVKLQVEFNPAHVAGYRLIGYENRLLANEDFNDDKKDAGEIGAGHSVTALYELVPAGVAVPAAKVDALKYTVPRAVAGGVANELMTVKVRYKEPTGSKSKLLSRPVLVASEVKAMSADLRWASAIAGFGMLLRKAPHTGNLSWAQVQSWATSATGKDPEGYRAQALKMMAAAAKLAGQSTTTSTIVSGP